MSSIPPPLKKGDTIGICSTARKISATELKPAIALLENWGFRVKLGATIGLEDEQFAGDDAARAGDLTALYCDPEVKAVMCARGGYGTARVVPLLDTEKFRSVNKWLVGFSDVTVLHAWFNTRLERCSIHGPMPITFPDNSLEALGRLRQGLMGQFDEITFDREAGLPANVVGTATGRLRGGNLSVLHSILFTDFDPVQAGTILFLEDLDEYLYHIDRMMQHFSISGKLAGIAGLLVGGMTSMNDNAVPFGKSAEAIIHDKVSSLGIPVAYGFPAGHISNNLPLAMGMEIELKVEDSGARINFRQ